MHNSLEESSVWDSPKFEIREKHDICTLISSCSNCYAKCDKGDLINFDDDKEYKRSLWAMNIVMNYVFYHLKLQKKNLLCTWEIKLVLIKMSNL